MTHIDGRARRWSALAGVLSGVLLAAACAASDSGTGQTPTARPMSTPSAEQTAREADTPIDGTWDTTTIAADDFRRALVGQGLGRYADDFLSDIGGEVDLRLEIGGRFWTLSSSRAGRPAAVADRGTFTMRGDRVLVRPASGGENVFRWSVTGDELTLELVSTTEPPYAGVPAETFQRGLYGTRPFRRVS